MPITRQGIVESKQTIANAIYILVGLISFGFLYWLITEILASFNISAGLNKGTIPMRFIAGGIPLIAGIAIGFAMKKSEKLNSFLLEVIVDMTKVTWPTRVEITSSTSVIIVSVIIISIVVGAFDLLFYQITEWIIALFK